MNAEEFADWVESNDWRFAKSMPEIPHEYTVVHWKDPEAASEAVKFIRRHGYLARWRDHGPKPYYDHGEHRYWVIWPVVNRCLLPEHGGHVNNGVVKVGAPLPRLVRIERRTLSLAAR